jgi:hypothetical protein
MSTEAKAVKDRLAAARRQLLAARKLAPRVRWDSDHIELLTEDVRDVRNALSALAVALKDGPR